MADRVVIMDEGEIAQVGSPKAIYREPANTFVAEFVGYNNILAGKVCDVSYGSVSVSSSLGEFVVQTPDDHGAHKGAAATFVVGADRVAVSLSEPATENKISCQLISEEFIGSVVTLYLETSDGTELKAQIQQRQLDDLAPEPGATLWLSWDASHTHLLPA